MIITTTNSELATASVISIPIGLGVIINTQRTMVLSLQGSECNAGTSLTSYFWTFSNEYQSEIEVTIELIPENTDEENLLKGVKYFNYERGQFYFLLVDPSKLVSLAMLATTYTDTEENNTTL
jgi:hypothetical protein